MGDFDWVIDIPAVNFYDKGLNLKSLDGVLFKTTCGTSQPTYSFSYDHTTDVNKTLIYDTALRPMELNYNGSSNGCAWPWESIRKNFISESWVLI